MLEQMDSIAVINWIRSRSQPMREWTCHRVWTLLVDVSLCCMKSLFEKISKKKKKTKPPCFGELVFGKNISDITVSNEENHVSTAFWAALWRFPLSRRWPFMKFQNQRHKWCFHSASPPLSYHVKYKRCPPRLGNFKPCLEIKHVEELAQMSLPPRLHRKKKKKKKGGFRGGEIYFLSLLVSLWCTLIQSQRGGAVELKLQLTPTSSSSWAIKNWSVRERARRRWENKGVRRREKQYQGGNLLLCSFSPNVGLPWQRDREGMCGIADEPPPNRRCHADRRWSSILPWKGCKNAGHQFRADGGELLALSWPMDWRGWGWHSEPRWTPFN